MMWIVKLTGLVLVSMAGFLFGAEKAEILRRRMEFWRELAQMLAQIQDAVHYRGLATPILLEELQAGSYPYLMLRECTDLTCFKFPKYIPPEDANPFAPLFVQIGQTGAQELCEQMPYYMDLCQQNSAKQEKEYQAAVRLYPQAGACAGLMAALLLL